MEPNKKDLEKEKDDLENTNEENEMKSGKNDSPDFDGVGVNEGWEKYMNTNEIKKAIAHTMVNEIEYKPDAIVTKTIIKKPTGNISVMSFDKGTTFKEETSPFDMFLLIIEGKAEIMINGNSNSIQSGQGIIIPAQQAKSIKANERFKMIVSVIKSGYE